MDEDDLLEDHIRRAKKGDMDSFEAIMRQFQAPIRGWVAVHSPPGVDADDAAQKTFIAAYQTLDRYELGTNFKAWLFTIARFQIKAESTRLRRIADYHSRYTPVLLEKELEKQAKENQVEEVDGRLSALKLCVRELKDKAQDLIKWRYEDGISIQEMSERTGRSVGAIKKNLFVLRQKLQVCIDNRIAHSEGA